MIRPSLIADFIAVWFFLGVQTSISKEAIIVVLFQGAEGGGSRSVHEVDNAGIISWSLVALMLVLQ